MSPFRLGRKVLLNVYEGDAPLFQCHTADDAARIVDLLNYACGSTARIVQMDRITALEAENRELRAALQAFMDDYGKDGCYCTSVIPPGKCAICMAQRLLAQPAASNRREAGRD